MSQPGNDLREVIISLATAALQAAETDAARTGQLIFRDEWKPTPRTRSSTTQPPSTAWQWSDFVNMLELGRSETENPPSSSSSRTTAPAPESAPESASASTPSTASRPPLAAARPTSSAGPVSRASLETLPEEDAVGKLLRGNDDVFDRLINHPFPQMLGDGTASLDGFRYYMIQDTLYLETCARLKMAAAAWSDSFTDIKNFLPRHMSSLEYVRKSKEILISMLGVPEDIIDTTPRSKNLDASEKFYRDSIQKEDAFFAYYIVLLPCVLSYWRIAERLMKDPSTVRSAVYHPAWIEVNYDGSSADKYIDFINANIMAKGGVDRWNSVFRIACLLEADLFNTGLNAGLHAPTPYQIIPNGTYSMHNSFMKNVMLTIQNVKGSDAGSSIVGMNKPCGNNERWHVTATKSGYTFRNLGTGLYLGISPESVGKDRRILQAGVKPYYWWINPASSRPAQGSTVYQIYDSVNLRYTLHADIELLSNTASTNYTPIIAHENSQVSCQMWSFDLGDCGEGDTTSDSRIASMNGGGVPGPTLTMAEFCRQYRLSDTIRDLLLADRPVTLGALLKVLDTSLREAGFEDAYIAELKRNLREFLSAQISGRGGAAAEPHTVLPGETPHRAPVGLDSEPDPGEQIRNVIPRSSIRGGKWRPHRAPVGFDSEPDPEIRIVMARSSVRGGKWRPHRAPVGFDSEPDPENRNVMARSSGPGGKGRPHRAPVGFDSEPDPEIRNVMARSSVPGGKWRSHGAPVGFDMEVSQSPGGIGQ
ncbi:hypothetical protein C8F04DRAFT_1391981 [Mycena alexandri]|uniref:Thiaminase-2/PQQC domain-containing protein n=1 Tax=Mycena alexandri TaxID=1745969 RepID=A0AAD6T6E5_9AGAR|nr:hypothetical protein C8F04DRAFT_1391981 [Mycena alexandri]